MSNTNDGGPAFPGTAPMDTEKLIEELPELLEKYAHALYWMRDAEIDTIYGRILSALRRLAAAEKVVDIARMAAPQMYCCGLMVTSEDLSNALATFDAAKEPPCPSN